MTLGQKASLFWAPIADYSQNYPQIVLAIKKSFPASD
jgi:hypothetical protein